tara:strand:+ start:2410 stop:3105 length:696 start_codon:yes stop_codon:yes gene_type:complete
MAIRRPLDTNVVDITGADLASDIAISTTGNIATTGSGTLTVAGASNFGSVASGTLGSSVVFPAGHVLQVVSAQKNDNQNSTDSFASGNWTDATGLSVSLTPSSATNYLYIQSNCHGSNETASFAIAFRLYISGGGTDGAILIGNQTGSRSRVSAGGPSSSANYFLIPHSFGGRIRCNDSTPNWSSGALTIKVQFATNSTSDTARFNRAGNQGNSTDYTTPSSSLTVMEIKG